MSGPALQAAEVLVPATPASWAGNPNSVAYDWFDQSSMWFFHWGKVNPGIWRVDLDPAGNSPVQLAIAKKGGADTDGGTIRPSDGYIFATDWEGDGVTIGDSIHLLDRTGSVIAFWETDQGLAGAPCNGPAIDKIQDVAMDHASPGTLYATQQGSNQIFSVNVSNTSNGSASSSPCTVVEVAEADVGLTDITGIEFDSCNDGFWLVDYESSAVVLVANDGTFNTIRHQFDGNSGLDWNDGASPDFSDPDRTKVWLTDYNSGNYSVWDSGLGRCGTASGNQKIRVRKFFDDDNPMEVQVHVSCNDGLIPDHSKWISENSGIEFVITQFTPGKLNCSVTETTPAGYASNYAPGGADASLSCEFEQLEGGIRTCNITNALEPVEVVVNKLWYDENEHFNNSTFARARWSCLNSARGQASGHLFFNGKESEAAFEVYPGWNGETECTVSERVRDSSVKSDVADCEAMEIAPGIDTECTITNTRIYEGVPTLRPYGLGILMLILLATGLIAFRRYS